MYTTVQRGFISASAKYHQPEEIITMNQYDFVDYDDATLLQEQTKRTRC